MCIDTEIIASTILHKPYPCQGFPGMLSDAGQPTQDMHALYV